MRRLRKFGGVGSSTIWIGDVVVDPPRRSYAWGVPPQCGPLVYGEYALDTTRCKLIVLPFGGGNEGGMIGRVGGVYYL